ncbi:UNVERIFIED_CONTAM: deoxyribonuclease HsdR, partial [Prevotella sp. 15_C9]
QGELIGINAALFSPTGSNTGYGFAIPTSIMKKVVADLKQFGTVQRVKLGVSVTALTEEPGDTQVADKAGKAGKKLSDIKKEAREKYGVIDG